MKKIGFESEFNGKKVSLEMIEVTPKIRRDADKYANAAFQRAIDEGYLLTIQIDQKLHDSKIDVENTQQLEDGLKELKLLEMRLLSGRDGSNSRYLTKSEGRELAIQMRTKRRDILLNSLQKYTIYSKTAEKYADNERHQYFLYACTLDKNTGRPFFKSFEDFKENIDSQLVLDAGTNYYKLLENDRLSESNNPEIKWLIKYGFMNADLFYVTANGELCDEEYRLINKDGQFINDNGDLVDKYGNRVDNDGNLLLDTDPNSYKE